MWAKETANRILVRAPNWIGDAVMCTPAFLSLRQVFPTSIITLLGRPGVVELLKGHPSINEFIVYEHTSRHRGILGKWRLVQTLRRISFDMAVLFQNAFEAALLGLMAGIPIRYGYGTDGRKFLLTEFILPPMQRGMHHVNYYHTLIESLSGEVQLQPPKLMVSNEEEKAIVRQLADEGIHADDILLGMNPGSVYGGAKRWLPERFASTADKLIRDVETHFGSSHRIRCVIVGGKGEEGLGQIIAQQMESNPIVLSGKTNLRQLMVVVKHCKVFITNDTGPMHIAHAFGVPVVAIFGPTDPTETSPFGSPFSIVQHSVSCSPCLLRFCPIDHRCMTGVSVEDVYVAARKQMQSLLANGEMGPHQERLVDPPQHTVS